MKPLKFALQTLLLIVVFTLGMFVGSLIMGTQCYQWNWGEIIGDAFNSEPATVESQTISPVDAALTQWPEFTVSAYEMNCCTIGENLYVQINFTEGLENFSFLGVLTSEGATIGSTNFEPSSHSANGWTSLGVPVNYEITGELILTVTVSHPVLGTTVLDPVTVTRRRQ